MSLWQSRFTAKLIHDLEIRSIHLANTNTTTKALRLVIMHVRLKVCPGIFLRRHGLAQNLPK